MEEEREVEVNTISLSAKQPPSFLGHQKEGGGLIMKSIINPSDYIGT